MKLTKELKMYNEPKSKKEFQEAKKNLIGKYTMKDGKKRLIVDICEFQEDREDEFSVSVVLDEDECIDFCQLRLVK